MGEIRPYLFYLTSQQMSIPFSGARFLDVLQENLSRVLTPWNYISVSPTPIRHSSSNSPQAQLATPSSHSVILAAQGQSRTTSFQDSDSEDNLKTTPFEKQFGAFISPGWLPPYLEISPVVRASSSQAAISSPSAVSISPEADYFRELATASDNLTPQSGAHQQENGDRDHSHNPGDLTDADADGEGEEESDSEVNGTNAFLQKLQFMPPGFSAVLSPTRASVLPLQSPCKILSLSLPKAPTRVPYPPSVRKEPIQLFGEFPGAAEDTDGKYISRGSVLNTGGITQTKDPLNTPNRAHLSSPLSPLTPLTSSTPLTPLVSSGFSDSPDFSFRRPTRTLARKRQLDTEANVTSAVSRKRVRLMLKIPARRKNDTIHTTLVNTLPIYSTRGFPSSIEISPKFPLFYRRYPVSSYFQPQGFSSPLSLMNVSDPGGAYNSPRSVFDLYTPRFVKGKGPGKLGLCPICIEPFERGGENKKNWLAMKFSAFKW